MLLNFAAGAHGQVYDVGATGEERPELIVGFKPGAGIDAERAVRRNAASVRELKIFRARGGLRMAGAAPRTELIELAAGVDAGAEIARLRDNPAVAFVEPNYPLELFQGTAISEPNDFSFQRLDNLNNTGQNGGKPGADIRALTAWGFSRGNRDLRVAVIDTGIDYLHEDLAPNIWLNEGEVPGNGLDDDLNGYIDDVHGFDFVSDDSDPMDDQEHGTHVAGILGARGDNELGTTGVCWEIALMALKAFNERGEGRVSDAVEAIHYAVDNGAKIINASWGLTQKSFALEQAIDYASTAGVLVVAAAGNGKTDAPSYPAAFEEVLSVAALDANDKRALFSNYGPDVDLAAPGQNIYSTLPESSYGAASGTSMAAPHISGVAALVLSRFPAFQREDVRDILLNSTDALITDRFIGRGRINAATAVQMENPLPRARITLPEIVGGQIELHGTAAGVFFNGYQVTAGAGEHPDKWFVVASGTTPVSKGALGMFDTSVLPDGLATIRLEVTNDTGEVAADVAKTQVRNTAIHFPTGGDVLRAGEVYEVRGTTYGNGLQYKLSVGRGVAPTNWVSIASGSSQPSGQIALGAWDTAQFEPDQFYSLRVTSTDGVFTNDFRENLIYIDSFLKEGWPRYSHADKDLSVADWRNLRPADLDGDGRSEFVITEPANTQTDGLLKALNLRGETLWTTPLEGAAPDIPAIGDVDGDGRVVLFTEAGRKIHAFSASGEPLGGNWPVSVEAANLAKTLADVTNDGSLELVTYSQEWVMRNGREMRELTVYSAAGERLRQWRLPWCGFTNEVQKIFPAVANLDDDPELEIVVVSGCNQVACYDMGSAEPVWVADAEGALLSSPLIGNVDGQGPPEIVVAAARIMGYEEGGIHVFSAAGELWDGWPVLEQLSFFNPPALGDLDLDGKLEICIATQSDWSLHVIQADGFHAEGWPLRLSRFVLNSSPSIGDVDGDGHPDLILAALGAPDLAPLEKDPTWVGGIQFFNYLGKQVHPSPGAGTAFPVEVTNLRRYEKAASPIILDVDGNGKLDLIATSVYERSYGTAPVFKFRSSLYAWELNAPVPERGLDWPMFGHDARNSGTYSLPLVPTNAGPSEITIAVPDRIVLSEDTPRILRVLDNDIAAEGTNIRIVSMTQPEHGFLTREFSGQLFLRPETNYSGLDQFTYTIRDSSGAESTATVLLKIKFVNDPPIAISQQFEMLKNSSLNVNYLATDDENQRLTFKIVKGPEHGELWNYPSVGTYRPYKGFYGTDSFSYTAHDGRKESPPATVTIHVINSNNPPRAVDQALLTKPNRPLRFSPAGSDHDGDPLTFEITTEPLHGTVAPEGSSFVYTPVPDYVGNDFFFFRAFDGTEYSEEAKISITIIVTNSVPVASGGTSTVPPNRPSSLVLNAVDLDGDPLTYILVSEPKHGVLSGNPPEYTYTPFEDYLGPDRLSFRVSDGQAESEPAEVSILVARVNHPPEASHMSVATFTNTPAVIDLEAVDEDGDILRGVILKGTTHGLLYGLGTSFTYEPKLNFSGMDSFSYKVWDGRRYSAPRTVTIYVAAEPQPLLPYFESITMAAGGTVELKLAVRPMEPFLVEASTNLLEWENVSGLILPEAQIYIFSHQPEQAEHRFYRTRTAP